MSNEFTLGINYWPRSKAMYWWQNFDFDEVKQDFATLKKYHIKYVRIFLIWEDFQPQPHLISTASLDKLCRVADLAKINNLKLMPTFFCGHMSGINWMPKWLLENHTAPSRFLVYSSGQITNAKIKNFYADKELLDAQILQIEKVCQTLEGHAAIWAYDLGNESSNCGIPATRQEGQNWLQTLTSKVKEVSSLPVTYGMHAEDLEEDRNLWPQDAGKYCDFVIMHGYPFYLEWADDPFDVWILPFLGIITAWLADKPVLFQEFGAPSMPTIPPYLGEKEKPDLKCPLFTEAEVYEYYRKALQLLANSGMIGAWAWCYADYCPELWDKPPLDANIHERFFGLFRHDGSPKLAARLFKELNELKISNPGLPSWLQNFDKDTFYLKPKENLKLMYKTFKNNLKENGQT